MAQARQHLWALVGVLAAAALLLFIGEFVTDDAMISLRYSRNLANGHGIVWSPGAEPVEGYSNFSHVLIGALALKTGLPPLSTLQVLNVLCASLLPLAVYAATWCELQHRGWAVLASTIMGLHAPMVFWSTSGLETASYALAATGLVYGTIHLQGRARWSLPVVFLFAIGTRPEAPLLLAITCSVPLLYEFKAREHPFLRANWKWIAGVAGLSVAYLLWRHAHFGHWLPNSASYKTARDFGNGVIKDFGREAYWLLIPLLTLPWRKLPRSATITLLLLASYIVGYQGVLAAVCYFHRFFLPLVPLLIVTSVLGLHTLAGTTRRSPRCALAVLAATTILGLQLVNARTKPQELKEARIRMNYRASTRVELALALAQRADPRKTIVVGDAGLLSYALLNPMIDSFGLNDAAYINEFEGNQRDLIHAILDETPPFITHVSRKPRKFARRYKADKHVQEWGGFRKRYKRFAVIESTREPYHYWAYIRRDLHPPDDLALQLPVFSSAPGWLALEFDRFSAAIWHAQDTWIQAHDNPGKK